MYNDYALFEVQLINSRPFEPTIYFLHIRTHFFNCESLYVVQKYFEIGRGFFLKKKENDMFYEIKFNAQCSRAIDFFDVNGGKQFQEKFKMFCINADKILPILEICSRHISLRLF